MPPVALVALVALATLLSPVCRQLALAAFLPLRSTEFHIRSRLELLARVFLLLSLCRLSFLLSPPRPVNLLCSSPSSSSQVLLSHCSHMIRIRFSASFPSHTRICDTNFVLLLVCFSFSSRCIGLSVFSLPRLQFGRSAFGLIWFDVRVHFNLPCLIQV